MIQENLFSSAWFTVIKPHSNVTPLLTESGAIFIYVNENILVFGDFRKHPAEAGRAEQIGVQANTTGVCLCEEKGSKIQSEVHT